MKKVEIQFQDNLMADAFKNEMKKRFNYPDQTSKYHVVHGTDKNGNAVFVNSGKEPKRKFHAFSSIFIKRK